MYILGGVSSGKSTLISKLIKIYSDILNPLIICVYSGFAPDETTQFMVGSFKIKSPPFFVQLPDQSSFISFFNQLKSKRLKYSELLLFLKSIMINKQDKLFQLLNVTKDLFNEEFEDIHKDKVKRFKFLIKLVHDTFPPINRRLIYWSDYILKTYAKQHNINFEADPYVFIANCLVSLSKALEPLKINVLTEDESLPLKERIKSFAFPPSIRMNKNDIELIPSVVVFDDVAQFPVLTRERASPWVKGLFAMTRRWQNTFIIASQRHSLLNKSLRALTHTFFIGYSLIDDDLPKIAHEMPSNILKAEEFIPLYKRVIKPFTFFTYNNKLGFNLIHS